MVGRLLSFWGPVYFHGRTVSFRDGIVVVLEINFFGLIQLMKSQHQFPKLHPWIMMFMLGFWQVLAASADGSAEDVFLGGLFALKVVKQHQKDLENTLKLFTKKLSFRDSFHPLFCGIIPRYMWLKTITTTPTTAMLQEMPVTLARLSLCSAPDGVSLHRDLDILDTVECDFHPKTWENHPMKSGII